MFNFKYKIINKITLLYFIGLIPTLLLPISNRVKFIIIWIIPCFFACMLIKNNLRKINFHHTIKYFSQNRQLDYKILENNKTSAIVFRRIFWKDTLNIVTASITIFLIFSLPLVLIFPNIFENAFFKSLFLTQIIIALLSFINYLRYKYPRLSLFIFLFLSFHSFMFILSSPSLTYIVNFLDEKSILILFFILCSILINSIYLLATPIYIIEKGFSKILISASVFVTISSFFILNNFKEWLNLDVPTISINHLEMLNISEELLFEFKNSNKNLEDLNTGLNLIFDAFIQNEINNTLFLPIVFYILLIQLILKLKISFSEQKANDILRSLIINPPDQHLLYFQLQKCSYYGGYNVERQLLMNPHYQEIIIKNES